MIITFYHSKVSKERRAYFGKWSHSCNPLALAQL